MARLLWGSGALRLPAMRVIFRATGSEEAVNAVRAIGLAALESDR